MNSKRLIHTDTIKTTIIQMIEVANFLLPEPIKEIFIEMKEKEHSELAQATLDILCENAVIARAEKIPLCQDCGAVIVFLEIGQDVLLEGSLLSVAINDAVAEAYKKFYLRMSITADPLQRKNTGTNTPAFIHTEITQGDRLKITVYLKGGGSENMTVLRMFRPTESIDTIIDFIVESVKSAGPNPCPPLFLGIGIGGTADVALLNAKKAVLRGFNTRHENPFYAELEKRILDRVNSTGVGPLGLGGVGTAAAVFIKESPTHIAMLPVALNLNCHSLRFREAYL